jgi:hypothetical protein
MLRIRDNQMMGSKYDPLGRWLCQQGTGPVHLTFSQVETILGFELPNSARTRPQWWENEANAAGHHVQCRAWVLNGWAAKADLAKEEVIFSQFL